LRNLETVLVISSVEKNLGRGQVHDLLPDLETPETAKSIANALKAENSPAMLAQTPRISMPAWIRVKPNSA
jgi:hypothetical protein